MKREGEKIAFDFFFIPCIRPASERRIRCIECSVMERGWQSPSWTSGFWLADVPDPRGSSGRSGLLDPSPIDFFSATFVQPLASQMTPFIAARPFTVGHRFVNSRLACNRSRLQSQFSVSSSTNPRRSQRKHSSSAALTLQLCLMPLRCHSFKWSMPKEGNAPSAAWTSVCVLFCKGTEACSPVMRREILPDEDAKGEVFVKHRLPFALTR